MTGRPQATASARRLAAVVALPVALLVAAPAQADEWPAPKAPEGARVETVARDLRVNGVPARIQRINVTGSQAEVAEFYRKQLGDQRVENRVREMQVIAAREGDYFHTVQLRRSGLDGVQATVMTTALRGAGRSAAVLDTERLLPAGASVLTSLQSTDDGARALTLVAASEAGVRANRDHLVNAFRERGFRLAKEDPAVIQGRDGVHLVFAGAGEEAVVTISDAGRYRSVLVNRVKDPR